MYPPMPMHIEDAVKLLVQSLKATSEPELFASWVLTSSCRGSHNALALESANMHSATLVAQAANRHATSTITGLMSGLAVLCRLSRVIW
jgi:hypothetical protein